MPVQGRQRELPAYAMTGHLWVSFLPNGPLTALKCRQITDRYWKQLGQIRLLKALSPHPFCIGSVSVLPKNTLQVGQSPVGESLDFRM